MSVYIVPLLIFSTLLGLVWLCSVPDRTWVGRLGGVCGWLAVACLIAAVIIQVQTHNAP